MRALIVDDELMPAGQLELAISRTCPQIDDVEHITNPVKALKYLKEQAVDVVFLDVEMPEMNGFEFIDLAGPEKMPPTIFTTAFNKYAVKAFRTHAIDYLLKPIMKNELAEAIQKVEKMMGKSRQQPLHKLVETKPDEFGDRLALAQGQSYHFIKPEEIVHLKGQGSYTDFFLKDGRKMVSSKRLNVYDEKLNQKGFMRVHQSHLVNVQHVVEYHKSDGGELTLSNGHQVPVGSGFKADVKAVLGL